MKYSDAFDITSKLNPGVVPFVPSNFCLSNRGYEEYDWMRHITEVPVPESDNFTCWKSDKYPHIDDIWAQQSKQQQQGLSDSLYFDEAKRPFDPVKTRTNHVQDSRWRSPEGTILEQSKKTTPEEATAPIDKFSLLQWPSLSVPPLDDIVTKVLEDSQADCDALAVDPFACEPLNLSVKSQSCSSDVFSYEGSPAGSSYLDGIWSGSTLADNLQSPGGHSDHNSTSYGSLQRTSMLQDVFNDPCRYGKDVNSYGEFASSPWSNVNSHRSRQSSAPLENPSGDNHYPPFGWGVSDLGYSTDDGSVQMPRLSAAVNERSTDKSWHIAEAFNELAIRGERRTSPYTAKSVPPIGTRSKPTHERSAFELGYAQPQKDMLHFSNPWSNPPQQKLVPEMGGSFAWNDDPRRTQWSQAEVDLAQWQGSGRNVNQAEVDLAQWQCSGRNVNRNSVDFSGRHTMQHDHLAAAATSMRSRRPETNPQNKQMSGHLPSMLAEELTRISPHARQQYVDAIIAAHLASGTALAGQAGPQIAPGVMWPHPAIYRYVLDPFVASHMHANKMPFMVSGQTPRGPVQYNHLPVSAPFAFPVPAFKTFRRTGPANELHQKLEEAYEQFKQMENERKKTEAELARQNPGKMVSSDNSLPIPTLSHRPSRVDRLVVESGREHAKMVTLLTRMENLRSTPIPASIHMTLGRLMEGVMKVQACRREEIVNAINRHQTRDVSHLQKENDVIALANALGDLSTCIRHARTALWSALQLSSIDLPARCMNAAKATARQKVSLGPRAAPSTGTMTARWSNEHLDIDGEVLTDTEDTREED